MIKNPPPLRNYAQMARVVRDDANNPFRAQVPYQLGKAYGTETSNPSEVRIRSLDEIGIHSRSPNQLQAPVPNNNYSRRESTSLYHQLSRDQQLYFDGISPNPAPTRMDARPGTKTRTYLNSQAASEHINVTANSHSSNEDKVNSRHSSHNEIIQNYSIHHRLMNMEIKNSTPQKFYRSSLNTSSFPVKTPLFNESPAPKQTRLPIVRHPSLGGTSGTGISFSLNF